MTTAEFEAWINNLSEEDAQNLYQAAENIKVAKVKTRKLPSAKEPCISIDEEPFVTLENGKLVCEEMKFSELCTVKNCRLLGAKFFENNHKTWLCSSSIDFPQEEDIDINIHEEIQKGFEHARM